MVCSIRSRAFGRGFPSRHYFLQLFLTAELNMNATVTDEILQSTQTKQGVRGKQDETARAGKAFVREEEGRGTDAVRDGCYDRGDSFIFAKLLLTDVASRLREYPVSFVLSRVVALF